MFDEKTLRDEIVKTWGPAGAHIEIYDMLLQATTENRLEVLHQRDQFKQKLEEIINHNPTTEQARIALAAFQS